MPNYSCECCSFSTAKKSHYNDHLKSKKHLNKISNVSSSNSVVSAITEPEFVNDTESVLKIKDLQNELKLKDQEIESLKKQLQMKDEIINVLKQQQIQQPIIQQPVPVKENIVMKVEEKSDKRNHPSPKQIIENLNKSRPDALPILKFVDEFKYSDKNEYVKIIQKKCDNLLFHDKENYYAVLPNTFNGLYSFSSASTLVTNMFCKIVDNVDKCECPIYCSDKHRGVFYIKFEDGWKHLNEEEFNNVAKEIIKKIEWIAFNSIANIERLNQYHHNIYLKHYPNTDIKTQDTNQNRIDGFRALNLYDVNQENLPIITTHVKSSLSKITCDKAIKFKPLKDEKVNLKFDDIEEDSCEADSYSNEY